MQNWKIYVLSMFLRRGDEKILEEITFTINDSHLYDNGKIFCFHYKLFL